MKAGKDKTFACLKEFLVAETSRPYKEVAEKLNMTEGAVKVAIHRMRRRYREILKEEVAETVAGPKQAEDEIRYLLAAVSR